MQDHWLDFQENPSEARGSKEVASESRLYFQRYAHSFRCTGDLSKCNQGAQQPLYWFQAEGNNVGGL